MSDGYLCPVCGCDGLDEPPRSAVSGASYEICPSCGFQFGVTDDDRDMTYEEWRAAWVEAGMPWRGITGKPDDWNPEEQLSRVS